MTKINVGFDLGSVLHNYYDAVLKINHDAEAVIRGLTDAQLLWRPEPHAWSIALCLDHLNACGRAELPSIRRAIAEGRARSRRSNFAFGYRLLGSLVVKVMAPTTRLKFKAPRAYLPNDHTNPGDVIRDFYQVQKEFLDCIFEANGLDLMRTTVPVLARKYLRLTLGQDLELFVVHEQRHLLQAQRIKARMPDYSKPLTNRCGLCGCRLKEGEGITEIRPTGPPFQDQTWCYCAKCAPRPPLRTPPARRFG